MRHSFLGPVSTRALVSTGVLCALGACDPQPLAPLDATFPDAAVPDAVIVHPVDDRADPCDAPTRVEGVLGTPSVVMFDTSMTETRPRDLGLACGNVSARIWAHQEVIEYVVPGTGPMGIAISTVNEGTPATFNTVVQVRRECRVAPTNPQTCFDDAGEEARAVGGAQAMGGDTLFIYVTGHSEPDAITGQVDEGRVRVTLTAAPNTAPTITDGLMRLIGIDSRVTASGTDPEGNILGLTLGLRNASGRLDFNGDGVGNELDVFDFRFGSTTGTTDWAGTVDISGMSLRLAEVCRDTTVVCTEAILVAYDTAYATSAPRNVPVRDAEIVGFGATCDAEHVCAAGLRCGDAMTCEPTPAALAACTAATELAAPPTGVPVSVTGTLAMGGAGVFSAPTGCTPAATATDGREQIYRVQIPTGTFDLLVTTARPGTGSTDTVLYVRSECGDATSTLGCQDDVMSGTLGSSVTAMNLEEGDAFVFVESYGGAGGAFELQATLRPVLAAGETCDPTGATNRCATGTCSTTTMLCP